MDYLGRKSPGLELSSASSSAESLVVIKLLSPASTEASLAVIVVGRLLESSMASRMTSLMTTREVVVLHLVVFKFDFFAIDLLSKSFTQVGDIACLQILEYLLLLLLALKLLLGMAFIVEVDPKFDLDKNFLIHLDLVQNSKSTNLLG